MPIINLEYKIKGLNGKWLDLGYVTSSSGDTNSVVKRLNNLISQGIITIEIEGYRDNAHHLIKHGEKRYGIDYGPRKPNDSWYTIEEALDDVEKNLDL
jgi:hypothetical protein